MRQLNFYDRLATAKTSRLDRSGRRPKPRKFLYRIIRERMRLFVIIGILSSTLLGGAIWFLKHENKTFLTTTGVEAFAFASTKLGITIENVYSIGHHESKPEAILKALGINRGDPILGFHPREARNRILNLTWVEKASVERHLPNTIS